MKAQRTYHLYLYNEDGFLLDSVILESAGDTTVVADREFAQRDALEAVEMKEVVQVGRKTIMATRSIYLRSDYENNIRMHKKFERAKKERVTTR